MSSIETWKPVIGYEGLYEVSDQGRVRSLDRVIETSTGQRKYKGRIMKLGKHRGGYQLVNLRRSGEIKTFHVHRLVAEAFIGPIPEDMHVDHINNLPGDNRLENLQVLTPHENNARKKLFGTSQADRVANGIDHQTKKTHCPAGHPYYADIIVPSDLKRGWRNCLVCQRAHNYIRYHEIPKSQHWAVFDYQLERFLLET